MYAIGGKTEKRKDTDAPRNISSIVHQGVIFTNIYQT